MVTKTNKLRKQLLGFTLVELMIVVIVMGILAGLVSLATISVQKSSRDTARDASVKVIATALEKYYRKNGEYPSVAFMTSQDVATLKQKLGIVSTSVFKLPMTDDATKNSIVTSNPSSTRLLYVANTSDSTKNTQCQTDINGYCDGFTLQYKKETDGSMVAAASLHDTFTPASGTSCAAGETQSGDTCTKTYAATYQAGSYSCPSGGSLSGTTCTDSTTASYYPGSSGYYYCPSGGSLSGTTCTTTSSYSATYTQGPCMTYSYTAQGVAYCTAWKPGTYSCPSGGTLSGTTCTTTSSYSASYSPGSSGYYYCASGYTLSGTTCTKTYTATQGSGYYTCPDGGTLSGSNCTYTYTLP